MSRAAVSFTAAEVLNLTARVADRQSITAMRDKPAVREKRGQKYGNTKVTVDGITFDSKAEHRHWLFLKMRQKAREISDLQRQVVFVLAPAVEINGRMRPPLRYVADFTYLEKGERIIADTKGAITDVWRVKRHLMKAVHGLDVLEIRA